MSDDTDAAGVRKLVGEKRMSLRVGGELSHFLGIVCYNNWQLIEEFTDSIILEIKW